jgi:hypothetical protein
LLNEQRVCYSVERFSQMLSGLPDTERKELVRLFVERSELRPAKPMGK